MYDLERLGKIMNDIEKYLRDLKELDINKIEDLSDKKNLYSVSMVLFSIINRTIDLADEIVMSNNLGMPSTYREIFNLLAKNGYIDNTLRDKMSNFVFYRNLVSHEYYDMTEKDIFNVMERIATVREFVDAVKNIIRKEMAKKGGM